MSRPVLCDCFCVVSRSISYTSSDFYNKSSLILSSPLTRLYLGHAIKVGGSNETSEINKRRTLTRASFDLIHGVFQGLISIPLKREFQCILPEQAAYGVETYLLPKKTTTKAIIAQAEMEREKCWEWLSETIFTTKIFDGKYNHNLYIIVNTNCFLRNKINLPHFLINLLNFFIFFIASDLR